MPSTPWRAAIAAALPVCAVTLSRGRRLLQVGEMQLAGDETANDVSERLGVARFEQPAALTFDDELWDAADAAADEAEAIGGGLDDGDRRIFVPERRDQQMIRALQQCVLGVALHEAEEAHARIGGGGLSHDRFERPAPGNGQLEWKVAWQAPHSIQRDADALLFGQPAQE